MEIAEEYADQALTWGPERSAQRNHGWQRGAGECIVFIDADMVLSTEIVAEAVDAFHADRGLGALVIPELAFGEGYLARCRALEKRIYLGDSQVEAARIFPRRVLEQVGGYNESLNAFEDWELPDRIRDAGFRVGRIEAVVMHDEGRIGLRRTFAKKRYYGRWLPTYRMVSGERGRRFTRPGLLRRPREVLRDPLQFAGLVMLKTVEGSGIVLGACEGGKAPRPGRSEGVHRRMSAEGK